ncbi:hypothetical protein MPH_08789 [Macrophomina phaseolina MS6]|uniref:Epoxide hydrolase N-terminal domain-containing protein n=1 Tax=Macrophomina phaseolina (strain MS6) TaxID=1126212 RepID=K2RMP8_MACPH|nr:hypothetical protein MPH_08789 [Macrophomina phaseolina MS6]
MTGWRAWEAKFNSIPQYTIDVRDNDSHTYAVHFMCLFSTNPSAIPIIFPHGWPGSVFEFLPLLLHLREKYATPDALPYNIVVPHLIGFGFSSPPPLDKDFT